MKIRIIGVRISDQNQQVAWWEVSIKSEIKYSKKDYPLRVKQNNIVREWLIKGNNQFSKILRRSKLDSGNSYRMP